MNFITEASHFIIPGVALSFYLVGMFRWRGIWFLVITGAIVLINDALCYQIIKPFFARPRPCHVLEDVVIFSRCSSNSSFPSNHASNIFAAATIMGGAYRHVIFLAYGIAFLVGLSRIYLGVHYPSDVLAGAIIGTCFGLLGVRVYQYCISRDSI